MKLSTSRSSCLIFIHSRWRGDLSNRAFAQSCAEALTVPQTQTASIIDTSFLIEGSCSGFAKCNGKWQLEKERLNALSFTNPAKPFPRADSRLFVLWPLVLLWS